MKLKITLSLFLCLFSSFIGEASEKPLIVKFSNGEKLNASLIVQDGVALKIHSKDGIRKILLDEFEGLRFFPSKREMSQKWRFLEAGKTHKERDGDPFPVIYLKTELTKSGGGKVKGSLYSTVLYYRKDGKKRKLRLMGKLRGKPGQKYADLVYPESLIIGSPKSVASSNTLYKINLDLPREELRVAALTKPGLRRLEKLEITDSKEISLASHEGKREFLAIGSPDLICVQWPSEKADEKLRTSLIEAVGHTRNFFDKQKLLGIINDGDLIFTLLMMERRGKTSLHREKSLPWRLEVWRWRHDQSSSQVLLDGREYLFRAIEANNFKTPEIRLVPTLVTPVHGAKR